MIHLETYSTETSFFLRQERKLHAVAAYGMKDFLSFLALKRLRCVFFCEKASFWLQIRNLVEKENTLKSRA